MSYSHDEVEARAARYAALHRLSLERRLGYGVHGIVWATDRMSAVKVHSHGSRHYAMERDIYLRLRARGVSEVVGFHVPELVRYDDELSVIEMHIVKPPFVVDFAGAYLDERPSFPDETWVEWEAEKQEQFGRNWPKVRLVMAALERFGVFLSDVTPNNIRFAEDAGEP